MTDENNSSNGGGDTATGVPTVGEAKPKDAVPSKPATEADLEKVETRMSGFERSTLRWTRASFIIVLATAVFICLQWLEMRSGGKDTHTLADAAKKQADKADTISQSIAEAVRQLTASAASSDQQVKSLQDQVITLKENFLKDQQPFVWFTNDPTPIDWEPDKKGYWTIWYTNYGKSPARILIDRVLEVGPDAMNKIAKHKMIAVPGLDALSKLPQGKKDYFSAFADVSQDTFSEAKKHDNWIVIAGTFVYYDLAGNLYMTDFCGTRNSNGSVGSCVYKHKSK